MLRQIAVGILISLCNIGIHALVMMSVAQTARDTMRWVGGRTRTWLAIVMVATVSVLLATHMAEVLLWAATYAILDVVPTRDDVVYFAFVNYTTLGYGDILPDQQWRLLGPMAAMNGILLFGWSTAVIFEVLRHAVLLHEQPAPSQQS